MVADLTDHVDQCQVGAAPAKLHAEAEGSIRIEKIRDGRFADAAALGFAPEQQSIAFQLAQDDRDRLGRERREAGKVACRNRAEPADHREKQAFIIVAHAAWKRAEGEGCLRSLDHFLPFRAPTLATAVNKSTRFIN